MTVSLSSVFIPPPTYFSDHEGETSHFNLKFRASIAKDQSQKRDVHGGSIEKAKKRLATKQMKIKVCRFSLTFNSYIYSTSNARRMILKKLKGAFNYFSASIYVCQVDVPLSIVVSSRCWQPFRFKCFYSCAAGMEIVLSLSCFVSL